MNKDFLNNTLENFLHSTQNRKLVLFGAGDEMHRAFTVLLEPNKLCPAYIVDNDFRKWYSTILGYKVYEPIVLLEEAQEELVLLITSIYPFRIKDQIERLGVKHYFASYLFIEHVMGKRQFWVVF